MTITYFRSPHIPEALNDRFEKLFKRSDIIFLEQAMGEFYSLAKAHFDQLSQLGYSKLNAKDHLYGDFQKKRDSLIANSKKQIEVERSPVTSRETDIPIEMTALSYWNFDKGNFKEACGLKVSSAVTSALINKKRDECIAKQLEDLQNTKRNKDILALFGASHDFQINLDKRGIKVKQVFPFMPYPFSFEDQLERAVRFDKPYTKETVARSLAGSIIGEHLNNIGIKIPERITRSIEIAEELSYEDIEALSKHLGIAYLGHSDSTEEAIFWLEEKGLRII